MFSLFYVLAACQPALTEIAAEATDSAEPTAPPRFTQVSVGDFQSCGVLVDGRIGCWGTDPEEIESWVTEHSDDDAGYHGDGHPPAGSSWATVEMSGMADVSGGGAGVSHSACALDVDGLVQCWGRTFPDQACGEPGACWPEVPFVQLAVGWMDACGRDDAGAVYCWGHEFGAGELVATGAQEITVLNWNLNVLHEDGTHSRYVFIEGWGWTDQSVPYSDDDVELGELRLVERSYNCVFSSARNAVLCDPFDDPEAESLSDGLRSTVHWNPPFEPEWVSGYYESFCALDAAGAAVCDYHVGSDGEPSPGELPGEFAQLSMRTGQASSGCGVLRDGSVHCWGRVASPTSETLRLAE